jgi:hypothetical protein
MHRHVSWGRRAGASANSIRRQSVSCRDAGDASGGEDDRSTMHQIQPQHSAIINREDSLDMKKAGAPTPA